MNFGLEITNDLEYSKKQSSNKKQKIESDNEE
jgi:hypothetical protein